MSFTTADLFDAHGEACRVLEPALRSLGGRARFGGAVVTLKLHEDNSLVRDALGEAGEGRVLVVDGGGSLRCALVGDRLAAKGVENGWAGIVVWGCVRDAAILRTLDIGCMALATNPAKSVKRGQGLRDVPVTFLGATVAPGDWLYADEDGVLVAPRRLVDAD